MSSLLLLGVIVIPLYTHELLRTEALILPGRMFQKGEDDLFKTLQGQLLND